MRVHAGVEHHGRPDGDGESDQQDTGKTHEASGHQAPPGRRRPRIGNESGFGLRRHEGQCQDRRERNDGDGVPEPAESPTGQEPEYREGDHATERGNDRQGQRGPAAEGHDECEQANDDDAGLEPEDLFGDPDIGR